MLLAIDVGNTHTVFGLWDGARWKSTWRRSTYMRETEDELAAWLKGLFDLGGIEWAVDAAVCGSVVPQVNDALSKMCDRYLGIKLAFLEGGHQVGLPVSYEPSHVVGADRIANALAALARYEPPIVVVDFGTATTFDVVDRNGVYVGGAILPGVAISAQSLVERTAKLPQVEFLAPETAIGINTVHSLQSGIMFGYAGAIDTLASRIRQELGGTAKVLATGGLGKLFIGICESVEVYEPTLTLDGLAIAHQRLLRQEPVKPRRSVSD
ncbi:MAG TPA: type III pantothenate kinase [Fimbriimonas sp.]